MGAVLFSKLKRKVRGGEGQRVRMTGGWEVKGIHKTIRINEKQMKQAQFVTLP